jgi:hypothetical protein
MVNNNVEVRRYECISIPYTNGSTQQKINFPDQPNLRNAKIHGLDLPYISYDYYGRSNLNYVGTSQQNIFSTLYYDGREGIYNMPLSELATTRAAGLVYSQISYNLNGNLALDGQIITWTKSYLTFSIGFTPIVADGVFLIGVYYSL